MQNGRRARQRLSDQPQKGRDLVESVVLVPKGAEGGWCHGTTGQGGGQKFENLRAGGSGPRVGVWAPAWVQRPRRTRACVGHPAGGGGKVGDGWSRPARGRGYTGH